MDLEQWVIELLESIKEAGYNGENFDLHLESEVTKEIASTYDSTNGLKYIKR